LARTSSLVVIGSLDKAVSGARPLQRYDGTHKLPLFMLVWGLAGAPPHAFCALWIEVTSCESFSIYLMYVWLTISERQVLCSGSHLLIRLQFDGTLSYRCTAVMLCRGVSLWNLGKLRRILFSHVVLIQYDQQCGRVDWPAAKCMTRLLKQR
jgi:hypothetical protein